MTPGELFMLYILSQHKELSAADIERIVDRARNDMKEGSPELWVIEIDDQMRATSVKV